MSRRRAASLPALALLAAVALGSACSASAGDEVRPRGKPRPLEGRWHQVAAGETLAAIAARYGVPLADLEEINGVDRRDKLAAGRKLFVPRGQRRGRSPDSGGPPPDSGGPPASARARPSLIWPVPGGKLTSRFGRRGKRVHEGIDIAAPRGTAVLAAADGEVIYAASTVKGYGKMVIVRHRGGLVTVYAHNRRLLVRQGQRLRQGQVLAEVGSTGRATGPHLHFEVRRGERPLDPLKYVKPGAGAR